MKSDSKYASEWRLEFARKLSRVYASRPGVKMIVVGGSPSRGLSDEYSDIDMVIYWNEVDAPFLSDAPLKNYGGELKLLMRNPDGSIGMELYYFDTLLFEAGHMTIKNWDELTDDVIRKHDCTPYKIKTIGGFYDAVPIYGEEAYRESRKKLEPFPRALAVEMVSKNLGFFWRGCVLNQGIRRNEIVFYHDAFCMTIKRLTAVLAGLNHRYFTAIEPRWLEYEFDRMTIKPEKVWERMKSVFESDPALGMKILEDLIAETVILVKKHMPEADLTRFNENDALEVRATYKMPGMKIES
jgi:predicted nucleotidyltransferase